MKSSINKSYKKILKGLIVSDCWAAYTGLESYGYTHKQSIILSILLILFISTHIQKMESIWFFSKEETKKNAKL